MLTLPTAAHGFMPEADADLSDNRERRSVACHGVGLRHGGQVDGVCDIRLAFSSKHQAEMFIRTVREILGVGPV